MTDPERPRLTGDLVEGPPSDLVAYLRRYGDEYTREAMAERLIEAGHDPGVVEEALAELDLVAPATVGAVDEHAQARNLARVIVGIAFVGLLAWTLSVAPSGAGSTGWVAGAIAFFVLFGGGSLWLLGRVKSIGSMVAIAAIAVLVGLPATFLGACLAYLGTGGRVV